MGVKTSDASVRVRVTSGFASVCDPRSVTATPIQKNSGPPRFGTARRRIRTRTRLPHRSDEAPVHHETRVPADCIRRTTAVARYLPALVSSSSRCSKRCTRSAYAANRRSRRRSRIRRSRVAARNSQSSRSNSAYRCAMAASARPSQSMASWRKTPWTRNAGATIGKPSPNAHA